MFHDDGVLRADVIRTPADRDRNRDHPVQKPPALLRHLLTPICKPGAVVLDPFMGGGTTLEAAKSLGCHAIGIESEESYCEAAAVRLSQQVLSLEVAV